MGFRENLIKKIRIKQLTETVLRSVGPSDGTQRLDREAMRSLLEMGDYPCRKERDLDLYVLNDKELLLLDNELKIYRTTAEDVALRKSPTIKEMVSIRNAIKILNDKDVVISRKADTAARINKELIDALDLSFTPADIQSLAADGRDALKNGYTQGVVEILSLFAELLGFESAPKTFQLSHHHIWGAVERPGAQEIRFGPLVMFDLMHNRLKMIQTSINSLDKNSLEQFRLAAKAEDRADLCGEQVWEEMVHLALQFPRPGRQPGTN